MSRIHLNIGSNQGDRKALIGRAAALIAKRLSPARLRLSSYVESAPWGYVSDSAFLNLGILAETARTVDPYEVLAATQEVELAVGHGAPHRNADGSYCDRPIDIDIIDIDGLTIDSERLSLPHPHAAEREFVLGPLLELDPDHPLGKSPDIQKQQD